MGSRFVATKEAPVHENMKIAMVEGNETDTTLIFRTLKNTARVYKNSISDKVTAIESQPGETDFSQLQELVTGVRGRERCVEAGDVDDGIWTVGTVMGLIEDIPSCEELLERMVKEAQTIISDRLKAFG